MLWAAFDFPRHPLAREDGERLRGAYFEPPSRWLRAHCGDELRTVIDQAHQASRDGAWVMGGLRYEAASSFDAALAVHSSELPLAEFAVYDTLPKPWPAANDKGRLTGDWQDLQAESTERDRIERIREYIRAGDCYQVNLTTRLSAKLEAPDLAELFLALHQNQPGGFSLFLRLDEAGACVASVSPELFFDWRPLPDTETTWLLAAQPMKGTAARGRDKPEDEAAQAYLRTSIKERAENLMIVDLLRNDIGRVATTGSVRVPRLFELHALPTVWQMTSTVTAVSRPKLLLSEVFAALFPCGSVTGAPKVRAMQIIQELEPSPRGWYCGALGLLQPGGVATFNVPIRTVEAEGQGLRCGIGSAITLDSEPAAEVAEWRAKSRFLLRAQSPIAALETLRLQDGAFVRLAGHMARLQRTTQHFGIRLHLAPVREALTALAIQHPSGNFRVRLTVAARGEVTVQCMPLPKTPARVTLGLAGKPIDVSGPAAEFLQHKTTRREIYQPFIDAKPKEAFDVLLWNRAGELTECSFGNIAVKLRGCWVTPPVRCGLLPGVYREELLIQHRLREDRILVSDLARAEGLAFINSLRGWVEAELIQPLPD